MVESSFKKFDIFRKMPKDLTEPTFCGALVSIICTFILVGLTVYEVQAYLNVESQAELVIDMSHRDDFVNVNIDVTFPKIPCDIIGLGQQDILGTHKTDVMSDNLQKHRLSEAGKIISTEQMYEKNDWRGSIKERVKKELDQKQGCQIQGFFKTYRVPGNFHIDTHSYGDIVMMLRREGYNFDFAYEIKHLSFGNKQDFDYIQRSFLDLYLEHPVDNFQGKPEYKKDDKGNDVPKGLRTLFYLVAVPSYFEKGLSKYHVYQLISNYEVTTDEEKTHGENILMFNFEFSPITESITQNGQSLVTFLIQICAIIGGVYTIAGIVDSMIYKSANFLFKNRIGKLA